MTDGRPGGRPVRGVAATRAERREARREAERRRMPQHGRGMGVMTRNAILRRAAWEQRRAAAR